jgi:hypothetical protein
MADSDGKNRELASTKQELETTEKKLADLQHYGDLIVRYALLKELLKQAQIMQENVVNNGARLIVSQNRPPDRPGIIGPMKLQQRQEGQWFDTLSALQNLSVRAYNERMELREKPDQESIDIAQTQLDKLVARLRADQQSLTTELHQTADGEAFLEATKP